MYNDMPTLLDPNDTPDMYDPVTGAPTGHGGRRSRRSSFTYGHDRRRSGSFAPPSPLQGYTNAAYFSPASPYLSPGALPSPQLVPQTWVNAYYDLYGERAPAVGQHVYDLSPRTRAMQLPSPHASPFFNVYSLPVLPNEEEYSDPRETWASRIKGWITGENRPDPHRELRGTIYVHGDLNPSKSGIRWNMAYPPHTVSSRREPYMDHSAFDPPLVNCRVVSPLMPWVFEISAHGSKPYITVLNFLADIYNCLKRPIERKVYDPLPANYKSQVDYTYRQRCMKLPDEELVVEALEQGIKRVDFLLERHYYIGLYQVKDMYQTFEIKFATERF